MAESQVPWGLDALNGEVTQAAWTTKPSGYLVATDDQMIPPDAQRFMSKRGVDAVMMLGESVNAAGMFVGLGRRRVGDRALGSEFFAQGRNRLPPKAPDVRLRSRTEAGWQSE